MMHHGGENLFFAFIIFFKTAQFTIRYHVTEKRFKNYAGPL